MESDRAVNHESVHGIFAPGDCWAVDAKVEDSKDHKLRNGSIARYWKTKEQAEADVALIARGKLFYKDGRRYFDAIAVQAKAYWR